MAAVAAMAFTGCSTEFDPVPVDIPQATLTPNTTLLELKTQYWDDATNYIKQIGTVDGTEDGEHVIIHGRVISNDICGNVFKSLIIQDETCALAFSINQYNLYLDYRPGQEIVIDATGMEIGKYNGLQQMGEAEWWEDGGQWEASFMAPEFFREHAQLNGLPKVAEIDTIVINNFAELPADPAGLRQFQSQLVRFNNVHFEEGGKALFSEYHESGINRNLIDSQGQSLVVRTSGYSNFWNNTLPAGDGDLVCILGYYGTTGWQLTLIDYEGCMNFGNPTVSPGAKDNPYTVAGAIEVEAAGKSAQGWVKGYIVGTVAPEVTTISSSDDIEWTAEATLANTMVIAADPECTDVAQCLVFSLPQDSKLRQYGNLRDNPGNYKKEILIYGKLDSYMGSWGLTGNNGASDLFEIEGVEVGGAIAAGNGTAESPYNPAQIVAMNPSDTQTAVESGVWVKGYIVGSMPTGGSATLLSGTNFSTMDAATTNVVIAPTADCTDYTKCVGIQLPAAIRDGINLSANPGNLGKVLTIKGDVMKYCGGPGIKNGSEYKIEGEGSGDTPVTPPVTTSIYSGLAETDTELQGWTIQNVNLGGLEQIWKWEVYNSKGYLKATAYSNGAVVSEAWAISPVIDLAGTTAPSVSFDQAAKFQTTLKELCGIYARVQGTTEWTKLSIPTWPAAGAWTFANTGAIDLTAFAGKKIELGLKYASSAAGADTWEVKNLVVSGEGGGSTPVDPNPGDDPVTPPSGDAVSIAATALTVPGTSTVSGYTFNIEKAAGLTAPAAHAATSAVRLYADNTMEISGGRMTTITFTLTSDNAARYTTITPSTGTITPAQATGDTTVTWVGDATSVTFTVGHDATLGSDGPSKRGQFRFTNVAITPAK